MKPEASGEPSLDEAVRAIHRRQLAAQIKLVLIAVIFGAILWSIFS
jgi:hypothetical protein